MAGAAVPSLGPLPLPGPLLPPAPPSLPAIGPAGPPGGGGPRQGRALLVGGGRPHAMRPLHT
eukprot:13874008-Alexandrium_andersonii.AAC.1